jgi:hypothetical protein
MVAQGCFGSVDFPEQPAPLLALIGVSQIG